MWPGGIAAALRSITLTGWAMALAVAGWALMWAAALNLVPLVPVSAAVLMFAAGLALIPFGGRRGNRIVERPPAGEQPQEEANAMRGSSLAASAAFLYATTDFTNSATFSGLRPLISSRIFRAPCSTK